MLSFRAFARSAPRAVSRFTSPAIRRPLRQGSFLQTLCKPAGSQCAAAFSTSTSRLEKEGEFDEELVSKFESEIQMEQDMRDADEVPTTVKDFLESSSFEVTDTPGQEEVVLTRKFGDETIRVTFSIADLNNIDPEADYEDRAIGDEEDIDSENINQGRTDEFKVAPEDSLSAADGEEAEGGDQDESYPARVNVIIEKAGKGAIAVETVAQDGVIVIDNVYYYPDASLAEAKTAEKAHQRQEMYVGPPFGNLDEDLQILFEKYLDERGINTALALFVPDYIDMKEQKEYLRWLSNVKSFVEA